MFEILSSISPFHYTGVLEMQCGELCAFMVDLHKDKTTNVLNSDEEGSGTYELWIHSLPRESHV